MGHLGLIPGVRKSLGEGNGYPLQYSDLENSKHCIVHGVAKNQTWLSDFHFHLRGIRVQSWWTWLSYQLPRLYLSSVTFHLCDLGQTAWSLFACFFARKKRNFCIYWMALFLNVKWIALTQFLEQLMANMQWDLAFTINAGLTPMPLASSRRWLELWILHLWDPEQAINLPMPQFSHL